MSSRRSSKRQSRESSTRASVTEENSPMIQEEEVEEDDNHNVGGMMMFSQQAPEPSQSMAPAKANERAKLMSLNNAIQQKAITDLSRLLLFKAFAGEPIDRLKCAKEVLGDFKGADRVTSAVYEAAVQRLEAVFGFEVKPAPASTGKLPAKFKDRYYVINTIPDESGQHFRSILSEHEDAAIERGLLMMILAFFFCKGSPRADGSRWLADDILYRLLNSVDENIPASPPNTAALKGSKKSGSSPMSSSRARSFGGKGMSTPNVDQLLERFVHMDYLLMEKTTPTAGADETTTIYAMGPRSLLEIGKKQVIYFCAELLDEAPDPTMLAEIESFQEEEAEEEVEAEAIHA